MSAGVIAAVLIAGAIGTVLRYGVTVLVAARGRGGRATLLPWAVLTVNVAGSAFAGAVLGLGSGLDDGIRLILLTGFAGGLTTFSTFSVETVQLAIDGRAPAAFTNVAANLVLGAGAAALAYVLVH